MACPLEMNHLVHQNTIQEELPKSLTHSRSYVKKIRRDDRERREIMIWSKCQHRADWKGREDARTWSSRRGWDERS